MGIDGYDRWIEEMEHQNFMLEANCRVIIDGLSSSIRGASEFYSLLGSCKSVSNCMVNFIRRQTN